VPGPRCDGAATADAARPNAFYARASGPYARAPSAFSRGRISASGTSIRLRRSVISSAYRD